jgi:hypothetical protein
MERHAQGTHSERHMATAISGRMTYLEAMDALGIKRTTLDKWMHEGVFTKQRDHDGPRARIYLYRDEVEEYLRANTSPGRGKNAVKQLRRKKGRLR